MFIDLIFLIIGLLLLTWGADWLVKGGTSLARRIRISPLTIGLTVVAIGTSSPELVVSLQAAHEGSGSIAIGNVIGSNICNILLILGVAAMISPLPVKKSLFRLDLPALLISSVILMIVFRDLALNRLESGLLIIFTAVYFWLTLYLLRHQAEHHEIQPEDWILMNLRKSIPITIIGLALLLFGADLLLQGARSMAVEFGWDEGVTGLLLVALGTSLPELAAGVASSIRKQTTLLIGTVIGSNIFNTLIIPGISFLIFPGSAELVTFINLWIMLAAGLLLLPLMFSYGRLSRLEGLLLTSCYLGYLVYLM